MKKYKYLFYLIIVFSVVIYLFHDFIYNPFIDVARELFVPERMLAGDVLYKDILNIYGAIPYFISMFLLKIFGVKFSVIILFNTFIAFLFVVGIYFLAKEFLNSKKSFLVALCVLFTSIANAYLCNFISTYSTCFIFGATAFLYASLYLIKYFKTNKNLFLFISSLLAGLAFASKNEFTFFMFLILFALIYYKKINLKTFLVYISGIVFFPIVQIILLFMSGISCEDIYPILKIIYMSATVPSAKGFQSHYGLGIHTVPTVAIFSFFGFWFLLCLISDLHKKKKVLSIILFSIVLILYFLFFNTNFLILFFPLVMLSIFIFNREKILNNKTLCILFLSSFLFSLKTFLTSYLSLYGAYSIPILIVALCVYLIKIRNYIFFKYIVIVSFSIFVISCVQKEFLYKANFDVKGYTFRTRTPFVVVVDGISQWIYNNTSVNDTVFVFPEGEMLNLITDRKTDNMLYSLHDIFIETYGDEYIKNRLKKMDYIVDISAFKYAGEDLSKISCETNYLNNILKDDFILFDVIDFYSKNSHSQVFIYKNKNKK